MALEHAAWIANYEDVHGMGFGKGIRAPCKATTGGGPYPVLQIRTSTRDFSLIAISQVIEDDVPAMGTNLVSEDPTFKE